MRKRYLTAMHLVVVFVFASPAFARITGGKDAPMKDRGFPDGSLPLANLKTRIAWWEGPPFGGEEGVDRTKGGGIGSWGGSANIGVDGTFTFENIPPGHYVVTGKPNPGRIDDRTEPIKVEIEGKDRHSIKLIAN